MSWESTGDASVVADSTGLALYRIVQESLSNASRHAPGADVTVRLDYGPDVVCLEVSNDGSAQTTQPTGTGGHGLRGMRDRAAGVSGWLDARARSDGGFDVVARLPSHVPALSVTDRSDRYTA